MKKNLKIILILLSFFLFNINSYATTERETQYLNPEWIKYMELPDDEKALYMAIPEQYSYEYISKSDPLNIYNQDFFSLDADENLEDYFTLANINGKRYVNSKKKNQSTLGLCWAFGSIGSLESNILLNGVKGLDEATQKCTEDNPNSMYCNYKTDKEINDYYINNAITSETENNTTIENATFSERIIDYIISKPANSSAYNNTSGNYTLIAEEYNPYNTNHQIGDGGTFSYAANLFNYGITPTRALESWTKYTTAHTTKNLYDVYDSVDSIYQVTNYYNYPSRPSNESLQEEWRNELKKLIKTYGSVYVSTLGPQSPSAGSCYYYDNQYEIDGVKQYINLINNTGNCGVSVGGHAMQIIGWDDNYTFGYCKVGSNANSTNYTSETCASAGYTWTKGTGAWILKNSWGSTKVYPYLSYQSTGVSISGVREVSIKNYDNSYNSKNSIREYNKVTKTVDGTNVTESTYEFTKTDNLEYLTRVNVQFTNYNLNYEIHVSNDGENYKQIEENFVDLPGLFTTDLDEPLKLDGNKFYVKIIGPSNLTSSSVNAFTANECTINNTCTNEPKITSILQKKYFLADETLEVLSRTQNIASGSKLEYKIYDANNNEITEKLTYNNDYVVKNTNSGTLNFTETPENGNYYLHTTYNDTTNVIPFSIVDKIELTLKSSDPIFLSDGTSQIKAILSSTEGVSNMVWESSDETVATVDENGLLTLNNSGQTTITLSFDTLYGEVSESIIVYVYDQVYTTDDFFEMQLDSNKNKAYYLMNDLDFEGIDVAAKEEEYGISNLQFAAIFNGGNHTIKNMNKTTETYVGLFNRTRYATIMDLIIKDSTFKSSKYAGGLSGYSIQSNITGIYNEATVNGTYIAGGILGNSMYSKVYECVNKGKITASATTTYSHAGGIIAYSYDDDVYDSYNIGKIYSETSWNRQSTTVYAEARAGGILGYSVNSTLTNTYNTGIVDAYSKVSANKIYAGGLITNSNTTTDLTKQIFNSYYLPDSSYDVTITDFERTEDDLKTQSTFQEWDFENIWFINEGKITPVLKRFPVEVETVNLLVDTKTLITNSEYEFSYEVLPYEFSGTPIIKSSDESIFEIQDNKIITKDKTGDADLIFEIDGKEIKYTLTVIKILSYSYDNTLTNKAVDVLTNIDYTEDLGENSYLKLIYTINGVANEHIYDTNKEFTFTVSSNALIELNLLLCGDDCTSIENKTFEINNIDTEAPTITYESNNVEKTLKINVSDQGISGLNNQNEYKYAISNSNNLTPMIFNNYTPNETMQNILMTYNMQYLWIKNISDNAGNKVGLNDYLIYKLDIESVEAEDITLGLFSQTLNTNNTYELTYEVIPNNITDEVIVSSEDETIFTIENNLIKTTNKEGSANLIFTIGDKIFKYNLTVKNLFNYSYDDALTNKNVTINIESNYFKEELKNSYLKLIYNINDQEFTKIFENEVANNKFSFDLETNGSVKLDLYLCNDTCESIAHEEFEVESIDKEVPLITYESNNINKTLKINVNDPGVSGLSNQNEYVYAISNNNTVIPSKFYNYNSNEIMQDILMNHKLKYLWIKNISDNAGNKASTTDYIIYELNIENVEAESVTLDLFSQTLNTNAIYELKYDVLPKNITSDIIITSEDESIFTIENNKIKTTSNEGTTNLVFTIGDKVFKYLITTKNLFNISYKNNITNDNVTINVETNYYEEVIDANSYLKIIYKIGEQEYTKTFENGILNNQFSFDVESNNVVKTDLYLCNNTCEVLTYEEFEIDNIDKEKPIVTYEADNVNKTLKINITDHGVAGLNEQNEYKYAISNSESLTPMVLLDYTPNEIMKNILMNHHMQYLWIKNISDNAGNKASEKDYLIYKINIDNVEAEDVTFEIFSQTLNTNSTYTFDYNINPDNITNDIFIDSEDKSLFTVEHNTIKTSDKEGTSNIIFKVGDKEFTYKLTTIKPFKYNYDNTTTNQNVTINTEINYYPEAFDETSYFKLVYLINEQENVETFDTGKLNDQFSFDVENNSYVKMNLYLCDDICDLIDEEELEINNIDKELPEITYTADNLNNTLKINVNDIGISGLSDQNEYLYAISNNNTNIPNSFKNYTPNTLMNNVKINEEYKYLWIKNIQDNAGNKSGLDEYNVYTIDINYKYYTINYYNENKDHLLKTEMIKENEKIVINFTPSKQNDDLYIYQFDHWEGYTEGMLATGNIDLIAIYRKIPKYLSSNTYTIKNNYIKNIRLDNINNTYNINTFKTNLINDIGYNFYENNNIIYNISYIKTGLKYKNSINEYKIVLAGDVTGDGRVRMNDVMKIANHLIDQNVLYNEYLLAGDVTNDDNVRMNDVMKIANTLVNGGNL